MSKRIRPSVRQVGDEVYLDENSDFEPETEESASEASESLSVLTPLATEPSQSGESDETAEMEMENQPSTSSGRGGYTAPVIHPPNVFQGSDSDSDSGNERAFEPLLPPPPPPTTRGRAMQRGRRGQRRGAANVDVAETTAEWTEVDREPEPEMFTGNAGILLDLPDDATPLDFFSLFIDEDQLKIFVEQTNIYAAQCIQAKPDAGPHSIFKKWKEVSLLEMKVFLALTINMGLLWKPEIRDYWSTDPVCTTPFWGSYMSRDRYLAILAFFHLVNNNDRDLENPDKLFKFRRLYDHLTSAFKEAYYPRRDLSVDESTVPWRGSLSFCMFIPSKPARYGVKLYCCCEADTGYVCRMQVYTGAGQHGPEKNHGENVVRRLTADFLNKGHVIYMDSFFSSVALFEYLREHGTLAVGTVLAGRVGVPRSLHPKELKVKKGEFRFRRKGNLLCLRYHDRKNLLLLSTVHKAEAAAAVPNPAAGDQGPAPTKPVAIIDYNQHMNRVDTFDQNLGYYSFHRKTIKWWKRMAMHLIHLSKVQAYILYEQKVQSPLSQYEFTKQLVRDLVSDAPMKLNVNQRHPPDMARLTERHFLMHVPASETKLYPSRLCVVCSIRDPSKENRYLRKKESRYQCEQCDLGMCLEPCFKLYHTRKDYKAAVIQAMNLNIQL